MYMNLFLFVIVFIIVLFFYIHVQYQLKASDELELYEIKFNSKDELHDICELKQPVYIQGIRDVIGIDIEHIVEQYGYFDVNIFDCRENDHDTIPLSIREFMTLLEKEKSYCSWKNNTFLSDTTLIKYFHTYDMHIRPPLVAKCSYDIIIGNTPSQLPLQYCIACRNYIRVHSGEVRIKLIPPVFGKYLHEIRDHANMIYSSPLNVWNIQDKYKVDYNKTKQLEIVLKQGDTLFIPPYWWWSIKFNSISLLETLQYYTVMNIIANSERYLLYGLQHSNIKRNMVPTYYKKDDSNEI